jgi:hypothetical protein
MSTHFLMNLFLLFPQLAFQQPAGNEPVWLWMPTNTVQERADREVVRKDWLKRKRILDAMAASANRKMRIANARNYQIQQQRQWQQWQQQRSRYQNSSSYNNGYGWRIVYINTPTGRVAYRVPY